MTGRDALVGGSVGPLAPIGPELARLREADARAAFREQLDGLLEGGIDVVVLETFSDLPSLLIALEVARGTSDLPVIASLTFGEDVALGDGTTPEAAVRALADAGADVIGVNCGAGPVACLDALERMAASAPDRSLSIMPNAGLPQRDRGAVRRMPPARRTSAMSLRGWSWRARGSSAGAAGRRPTTCGRCGWRSMRSRTRCPASRRPPLPRPAPRSSRRPPRRRPTMGRSRRRAWPPPSLPAVTSFRSRSTRRARSASSGRSTPRGSSAMPASTSSMSRTPRWPGCGWARSPSRSASSTTSTSSAWSISRPATGR